MPTEDTPSGFGRHLRLPDGMRKELRVPLGRILDEMSFAKEIKRMGPLVTIGDYCTMQALKASARPRVAAVDLRIERHDDSGVMEYSFSREAEVLEVENPPAHITPSVWRALEMAFGGDGNYMIRIQGEEDLVALPAIALAPTGFAVVYGLPGKGAVVVDVNDETRSRVGTILSRMEVVNGG